MLMEELMHLIITNILLLLQKFARPFTLESALSCYLNYDTFNDTKYQRIPTVVLNVH